MIDAVEREVGTIDILVNSAGAAKRTPPDDLVPAAWHAAMDAKFFSYIHVIDPLIKRMAARGSGVIVNVIGNGGKVASPIHVAGGAANAALMLATAGLANAYAGPRRACRRHQSRSDQHRSRRRRTACRGAPVRHIAGRIAETRRLARIPFGRMVEPEEIARLVTFLASPQAGYVSGVTITMDGVTTPLIVGNAWTMRIPARLGQDSCMTLWTSELGLHMHSRYRRSPAAVMNEALRQSFPPQHDLAPAMSAVLAKLAALEAESNVCAIASAMRPTEKQPSREPQMA
jgi:NADP-dependent 3-hydroxy acid dehydrogenase YdfG